MPTTAISSLFVAVTATPRKSASVPAVMVRGPNTLASPDGVVPCSTMLWPRPVPVLVRSTITPPSVDFLSRSLRTVWPPPTLTESA